MGGPINQAQIDPSAADDEGCPQRMAPGELAVGILLLSFLVFCGVATQQRWTAYLGGTDANTGGMAALGVH